MAGAYWRGDSKHGDAHARLRHGVFSKKDLEQHLRNLEEAEKHAIIVSSAASWEYMMDESAGVGLPPYLPKRRARHPSSSGMAAPRPGTSAATKNLIAAPPPQSDVWKTSGHYGFYKGEHLLLQHQRGGRTDERPRLSEYGVQADELPGHVMQYKTRAPFVSRSARFAISSSARSIVMR